MKDNFNVLSNAAFKYCELSEAEIVAIRELYITNGQQKVFEYAKNKKILPFVAMIISRLGIDEDFWDGITSEYRQRTEIIIEHLDIIFSRFSKNKVKKVFVTENFGALLLADIDKALFASGDVDIYADIIEKDRIYESFKQLGYSVEERYSHKKLINTSFYNDAILPNGFHFGVAWNPLSRIKLPSFIEADDFVEWDKLYNYKNTAIKLPGLEALMYICLLHISLHSFSRAPDIRLYMDINNISRQTINWEKIIGFAQHDVTMVRLLTACILSNKLLSVDIPDFVLKYQEQYKRSVAKLLKIVYHRENNCLVYEPRGIKVLYIEILSDDKNILNGIWKIIFPNKRWVKDFYVGEKGNIIIGYFKHLINLFK